MSNYFTTYWTEISLSRIGQVAVLAYIAVATLQRSQLSAQPPVVELTQIGSPIWLPADFQLFSAPADTDAAFFATIDSLRPLDGPTGATTYTTPHAPPYESELSANVAAAEIVNRSVFPREAITNDPNSIFVAFMLLPEPGVTGSSRDFASGPVIPNSLFPITGGGEALINGAFALDLGDARFELRPTDLPFDGTSHRPLFSALWMSGANNLGDYEWRLSLRDTQGNGWHMAAPFRIVAALPQGDFNQDGTVDAADYIVWRKGDGTQTGYDIWRANFGRTVAAGGSPALMPTGEPPVTTPAVPEPSSHMIACIAAIGIRPVMRRTTGKGRLLCTD